MMSLKTKATVAMVAGLPARDQFYKTFFFVTDDESKQTRAFVPGKPFRTCLMFVVKARSLAPTLLTNFRLGRKKPARSKCSSLFGNFVSYKV